jgi:hypothetical protein
MMTINLRQHSVVVFVISWTVLSIALSGSAFAQFKPSLNLMQDKPEDPATEAHRKAVENEYKSKLKEIPDRPQTKVDPWANIRSSNPSQK